MQRQSKIPVKLSFILIILSLAIACVPVKELKYFNDIDQLQEPAINPKEQKRIMRFDKLYINVLSIDEKTNQLFNASSNASGAMNTNLVSNLVDENGNINYPFIGNIKVEGLTTAEAGKKIEESLNEYVSNAAVTVRFIENSVSILGEVVDQGVFTFTQDKLNIYEALALGGGLTRYGDHKNIILVRQEGDKIMYHKLNLSDSRISGKEYYYILPNDVIVAEPIKSLSFTYGNNTFSIILSSITTLLAILLFGRSMTL